MKRDATELPEGLLARLGPSKGRRLFGLMVLGALAVVLARLAFARGADGAAAYSALWQVGLIALAAFVGLGALRMYRATGREVWLTETALIDSNGVLLANVEDILGVDRGVFAFKPSNGFLLRLSGRHPRLWQPGLYWRIGRRLGVGGIVHAAEAKAMSDTITAMLIERGADL